MRTTIAAIALAAATAVGSPAYASGQKPETERPNQNFNPSGYPVVKEKVTLRVLVPNRAEQPRDINEVPVMAKAERITNVHIEWIMPGSGFNEKKSLMLASGDLPDFIIAGVTELEQAKYGKEGEFIALEGLIDKYGSNLQRVFAKDPQLRAFAAAPDGHIYATPRVNQGPWMKMEGVGVINRQWLNTLGLKTPETLDEFHATMKAFKSGDPNKNGKADEIPITFRGNLLEVNGFAYLLSSFGFNTASRRADLSSGQVIFTGVLPQFKEGIKYVSKLYAEGLIDVEGFTNTAQQYSARLSKEPFTVGYTQLWEISGVVAAKNAYDVYNYMPPLKGPGGREPVIYRVPLAGFDRGGAVITRACKSPEVALRYIDYAYDTTNSMEWAEGEFGKRLVKQPEGYYFVADPPAGQTVAQWRYSNCPGNTGCWAVFEDSYRNVLRLPLTDTKVKFMDEQTMKYADRDPFPPVFYTAEEAERMSQINTDIMALVERKASAWIMKGTIDSEWDSYVTELDRMGLKDWLKINQNAYERFARK